MKKPNYLARFLFQGYNLFEAVIFMVEFTVDVALAIASPGPYDVSPICRQRSRSNIS